jgi:tellurite methyltransferase
MNEPAMDVVAYWDGVWQDEDYRRQWWEPHPFVEKTAAFLLHRKGLRILDLGCGIGRHSLFLARSGQRVVALDGSFGGVAVLREQNRKENLSIACQQGNFDHLPCRTGSLDGVVCWDALYHGLPENMDRRLGEIDRVLKPGGFFQATFLSKENRLYRKGRRVAPGTWILENNRDKDHPHFYCSRDELLSLLSALDVLAIEHEDYGSYPEAFHWLVAARKKEGGL